MTSPKSLHSFGPEYEHLLNAAFANPPLAVPMPSERHAKSFRGKLYAYFAALRSANLRPDLIEKANALALTLEGPAVVLRLRSASWDNVLIRSALGLDVGEAPALPMTSQDALLARLAQIRQKGAKT